MVKYKTFLLKSETFQGWTYHYFFSTFTRNGIWQRENTADGTENEKEENA